jgi:hypothetical protein
MGEGAKRAKEAEGAKSAMKDRGERKQQGREN